MIRLIKKLAHALGQAVIGVALLALALIFILEWASGCGETYTDYRGEVHTYECRQF